jgi:hypothetical protein
MPAILAVLLAFIANDPADAEARAAVETFRKAYVAEDPEARCRAVAALAECPHALVVEEAGKTALADAEPSVRDVAAQVLGRMKGFADAAGPFLRDRCGKEDACPDVQISIVRAIGRLGYAGAHDALLAAGARFAKQDATLVTLEVIRTLGVLKDVKALPFLLKIAEYGEGEVIRGRRGPAMRVPFGQDPSVSRWNWMRKYGKAAFPGEKPPVDDLDKWWMPDLIDAVQAMTGQEFDDAAAFRAWLTEHLADFGLKKADLPKPPGR